MFAVFGTTKHHNYKKLIFLNRGKLEKRRNKERITSVGTLFKIVSIIFYCLGYPFCLDFPQPPQRRKSRDPESTTYPTNTNTLFRLPEDKTKVIRSRLESKLLPMDSFAETDLRPFQDGSRQPT